MPFACPAQYVHLASLRDGPILAAMRRPTGRRGGEAMERAATRGRTAPLTRPRITRPRRILIVEDDDHNAAVMQDILQIMFGQRQVEVAHDGHEGIRMAYENSPDLILMDLALPKLDGWQVTRSLRSNPRFRKTPILAVTAHAMKGDRERALEAGCSDYLAKPIEVDEFVRFVRPYLAVR